MPTPESPLFLAKKPTVPPTYQGVDFSDNEAVVNARDAIIREQWVKQMMQRIMGEEMGRCYVRHGVNHLENCAKYRERYLELLRENREKGYLGREKNYTPGIDGPSGGPVINPSYPTVQQAMGGRGSDSRPGNTSGLGVNERY